jgi:UDP-N-acetylglucosamine:LPS N-acetylglucosamine transferase
MDKADRLEGDRAQLQEMSENARKMAILDSRERIFEVIRNTLEKHGKM